jgi:hypothetical protein
VVVVSVARHAEFRLNDHPTITVLSDEGSDNDEDDTETTQWSPIAPSRLAREAARPSTPRASTPKPQKGPQVSGSMSLHRPSISDHTHIQFVAATPQVLHSKLPKHHRIGHSKSSTQASETGHSTANSMASTPAPSKQSRSIPFTP